MKEQDKCEKQVEKKGQSVKIVEKKTGTIRQEEQREDSRKMKSVEQGESSGQKRYLRE